MAGRAAALSEPGKADSIAEIQTRRDFVREAWLAASACIRWIPAPSPESAAAQENARALVFLPAIGLALGVMLALCDRALYGVVGRLPASAIIVFAGTAVCGGLFPFGVARTVTALIGQSSLVKPTGAVFAMVLLVAEISVLAALASPPARARALVLAMLLSRWSIVPIGYGLKPLENEGLGVAYRGGITFTEFGLSSVIALGAAMGLYDIVGLAAIVAVALTILAVRLLISRRLGGAGGNALAAGAAVCELAALAVAAVI